MLSVGSNTASSVAGTWRVSSGYIIKNVSGAIKDTSNRQTYPKAADDDGHEV
jgi:hypothetical protein